MKLLMELEQANSSVGAIADIHKSQEKSIFLLIIF